MGIHAGQENHPTFRVFFIPFFATGHMVPMVDLARQFAVRGVDSTMVVTPANAALIRRTIDRAAQAALPLRVLTYPFPAAEVGLPEGQENLSTVPPSDEDKIYIAVDRVQASHDRILREYRPDAVISDIPFWWTTAIAAELGIPRVTFHAVGAFPQCVMNSLWKNRAQDKLIGASDDSRPIAVPDLPDPIEMSWSELPEFLRRHDHMAENFDRMKKAQLEGYGVVVNTFYELEPAYVDLYRAVDCRRGWFVGPLALCYSGEDETTAMAERGGDESSASNNDRCMAWLRAQAPASVVFVCLGSWCHTSQAELREMAFGLKASGVPFLWVVREEEGATADLPAGFEESLSGRGLVVRGWAPQAAILRHPAVGAFLTHCGWNSVTEGVAAGVPMITCPLVFEQFINERLLVGLLRVGVRMHGGFRGSTLREEAAKVVVGREVIAQVVARFAPGVDEEVEGMRRRARALAAAAREAVGEGGTSYRDLNNLIEALKRYRPEEEDNNISM